MRWVNQEKEFLEAYDAFSDAIFRHCYFRVFDRERAKDLVQETFMKTWEYIAQGKKIQNFRAFLYRVANNLIIDESRKKRILSLDELQERGLHLSAKESGKIHGQIEVREIVMILHTIEDPYRQVLLMRYVDDLSPKEIAEILDETENAVSVRIHRGIQKLRKLLQHE